MRAKLTRLLFGLALGAAWTGAAAAAERLVMPFACHVAGGQVSLAPSAPQAYQIYGSREQKRMTTCSPYDPRKCHNWSVYRFDLDCGGVRTSWHSVVAALSPILAESVGPPGHAGPYDDLAYAAPGPARPHRGGPGRGIAFPPGFAPNPMRVAKFEGTAPATAHMPLPPKKPVSEAPTQIAGIAPSPEPAAAEASSEDSGGKVEAASETSSDKTSSDKTSSGKTASDKTPAEPKAAALAEQRVLQIEIEESASGEVTGSLPKADAGSLWRDASTVFTLTLAVLFALSATVFLGRRRMQTMPVPVAHFQGAAAAPVRTRASHLGLDSAAAHTQGEAPATRLRLWDEDWLPGTTSEALDVLGVDPDASRDTIKTTVTRLRRALHPDYALDDEDRALRERRLKQINVAWEIVSGKRRAPWLSVKPRSS